MFSNDTYRTATELFMEDQPVDDFVYEGDVGFDALVNFLAMNEAFELELVMVYLDIKNGIDSPWPKLPMLI